MSDTRTLEVCIDCRAYYNSVIQVPVGLSVEEAIEYAKEHIREIPILTGLEYIEDSDVLDEENCYFSEEV